MAPKAFTVADRTLYADEGPARSEQRYTASMLQADRYVFKDGSPFTIVDDWTGQSRHTVLKKEWRGITSFVGCPNARSSEFLDCFNLLATAPADNLQSEDLAGREMAATAACEAQRA